MMVVEEYSAEIIKLILSMTFTGSMVSLFLFTLKPIIKDRLPKSFQYYMWFSVVIALMLPVSKIIEIPVSNDFKISMKSMYDIAQQISDLASEKPVNLGFVSQSKNGQTARQVTCFSSTAVLLSAFWQLGMVLVLGFHIICYALYVRKLNIHNISAERQEVELLNTLLERKSTLRLYKNPVIETPILIGFFLPAVILPDRKYEDMKLRNILMHEITHKKRYDIFVKWLLILVGAVHWFNPIVYLVRREMNKACELACDESVIKRFDNSEMQQYGDTLIAVAADSIRKMPLSITMFEDKKILKERLDAIMKHKKHSKRAVIAASVFLTVIVCAVLGLSALHGTENEYKDNAYADNYPLFQDQKRIKELELKKVLRDYDKKNIVEAYVFLGDLEGEITNAYIMIVCQEKNPNSEMQSGIKSLASEELELDVQNVYVDYIDFESFTSN
ncbi:MAG: M56 family metallopeptidase [Lachnospiraceae bacterium]|nr:M56 family metallopeptidase [Lachnospiraceae bacterium]